MSRVATLAYFTCPVFNKKYETCKETRNYDPVCTGKKQQLIEIVPEEAQKLELLDKYFKSAILNMFKELKETVSKE